MTWTWDDLKAKGYGRDGKRLKKNSEPSVLLKNEAIEAVGSEGGTLRADSQEAIFIPYEVRSKKNSKQIIFIRDKNKSLVWKDGLPVVKLISSKSVKEYVTATKAYYIALAPEFRRMVDGKAKPYKVEFTFVRSTKARFDYNNIGQLVQDLMADHGWIDDDDANNLLPVYRPYVIDKANPGVQIRVL